MQRRAESQPAKLPLDVPQTGVEQVGHAVCFHAWAFRKGRLHRKPGVADEAYIEFSVHGGKRVAVSMSPVLAAQMARSILGLPEPFATEGA